MSQFSAIDRFPSVTESGGGESHGGRPRQHPRASRARFQCISCAFAARGRRAADRHHADVAAESGRQRAAVGSRQHDRQVAHRANRYRPRRCRYGGILDVSDCARSVPRGAARAPAVPAQVLARSGPGPAREHRFRRRHHEQSRARRGIERQLRVLPWPPARRGGFRRRCRDASRQPQFAASLRRRPARDHRGRDDLRSSRSARTRFRAGRCHPFGRDVPAGKQSHRLRLDHRACGRNVRHLARRRRQRRPSRASVLRRRPRVLAARVRGRRVQRRDGPAVARSGAVRGE